MDYLDDFLGDFQVDCEFSNFETNKKNYSKISQSPSNLDQRSNNDWSIPIGEIDEDIQSPNDDENDVEKSSNDNEEQVNSQQSAVANNDQAEPVIPNFSSKSWSGVKFDSNKLSSVIDNIKTNPTKDPASQAGAYVPKAHSQVKSVSQSNSGVYFPALGEETKVEEPKPKVNEVQPPKPAYASYGSAMSGYTPKSSDYSKLLQSVSISNQPKPIEASQDQNAAYKASTAYQPSKQAQTGGYAPKPAQQTGYMANASYKPKTVDNKQPAYQPKSNPAPQSTQQTNAPAAYKPSYTPKVTSGTSYSSYMSKVQK